jgi:Ribosomal protein S5, N-terminal domain
MATRHEIGQTCQSWKDHKHGANLPALASHQGVSDCGLVSAQAQGRSHEGKKMRGALFLRISHICATANNADIVRQIKPVQKQTRAGQRTRFKAIVVIGDSEGHVGLGIKTSKEVATAIRAAIIIAKLSVLPIRRGYWGTNLGAPHSLPTKQSGKCGSVTVRVRNHCFPPHTYSKLTMTL